ncbi:MAG TPA: PadR family transcriptional regulator [Opitutaceae bacterium]|nr:PadR family transcriptional regulator [Opitutaceae bacterium]HND63018.1 PadR family transcriptional regulator [Opitutaceae bacterium]
MAKEPPDLLQGTLDMLILKALERGPIHGFGISIEIRKMSQEILQVEQGSLYPALYRLEEQGLIRAEWGVSDNNRKARFYSLTTAGRKQLAVEASNWAQVSAAINLVLKVT